MRVFLIVFSLLAIAVFAFHFQKVIYDNTTRPWTEFLAFLSVWLISLFDASVIADGVMILTDPAGNSQNFRGIEIVAGCNGIEAWLILVAAIMAFPPYSNIKARWILLSIAVILLLPPYHGYWLYKISALLLVLFVTQLFSPLGKHKLLGVIIGFAAVQSMNVVRVISLFYLGQWDKGLFDFAHYYLWQALIILDAFVVFLLWLSKLPDAGNDGDNQHTAVATTS